MGRALCLIIAFSLCALAGYMKAAAFFDRLKGFEDVLGGTRQIREYIAGTRLPMPEVMRRIAATRKTALWRDTAAYMQKGSSFETAWSAALTALMRSEPTLSRFNDTEKATLLEFGQELGKSGREAQLSHIDLTICRLEEHCASAKAALGKGRLYQTLGVMCGAMAAIILW